MVCQQVILMAVVFTALRPLVRVTPNKIHIDDPSFLEVLFTGPTKVCHFDPVQAISINVPRWCLLYRYGTGIQ